MGPLAVGSGIGVVIPPDPTPGEVPGDVPEVVLDEVSGVVGDDGLGLGTSGWRRSQAASRASDSVAAEARAAVR